MARKIIVLDDDPTGIQTVNGIFVFTNWDQVSIKEGLLSNESMFYILTNSRALTKQETIELHKEIANNLVAASQETGVDFLVISRGDSTLRGHYPTETETLRKTIESLCNIKFDGEIICPFFMECGRLTKNGVHYLNENNVLIPVSETEFAQDRTFPFFHSDLSEYVEEKTQGEYKANQCPKITESMLEETRIPEIVQILSQAQDFCKIILDGTSYDQMNVFKKAFEQVLQDGKNFLIRSAASLPKVLGNINDRPFLEKRDLIFGNDALGGLVVVGSHVDKTNRQLKQLMNSDLEIQYIEFDAETALDTMRLDKEYHRVKTLAENFITCGKTVVVYTSRTLLTHSMDDEEKLKMSVKLSWGVSQVVNSLEVAPKFIISKGGITSSDIGTKGLEVKKAKVLGQVKAGIPVWETDEQSKFPKIPYIIFPGNVGKDETLLEIVNMLK